MAALNVAGTVVFVSASFWFGQDHSPMMLLRWAVLFGSTLVFPMYLAGKVESALAQLPKPVSPGLRRAAVYPVWVGIMTLVAALALVERLR